MSNKHNSKENPSDNTQSNQNNSEPKQKHRPQSKNGIIIEVFLSLLFLVPYLIYSFFNSILLILAIILSISSVLYIRLKQMSIVQLRKEEYDDKMKKIIIIGIFFLIGSIFFYILTVNSDPNGIGPLYLTVAGLIVGLRIWNLIILFLLSTFSSNF